MSCRFSKEALPLEATPVENMFILEYMPSANALQLQVYLYGLMLCRYPAFLGMPVSDALGITEDEVLEAFVYWQREGLVRILNANPLDVEYTAPSERRAEPTLVPGKHHELIQAVQQLFAPRSLRPADLRRVYDWVDVFSMEDAAVLELISHCIKAKDGSVSMNYIDKVALAWADAGVTTAKQARARAQAHEELTSGAALVLKRWNKSRRPTQDELALYEKWTQDWGFTPEAVLSACPAITRAERPSFKYLDGVLERLKNKGIILEDAISKTFETEEKHASISHELFAAMGMGRASRPAEREQLAAYIDEGFELQTLKSIADYAASGERPFAFFKRLVSELKEQGIYSFDGVAGHLSAKELKPSRTKRQLNSADYPQKQYSDKELQHIYVKLDEEAE